MDDRRPGDPQPVHGDVQPGRPAVADGRGEPGRHRNCPPGPVSGERHQRGDDVGVRADLRGGQPASPRRQHGAGRGGSRHPDLGRGHLHGHQRIGAGRSAVGSYQVGGVVPGTYTLSVSRRGTSPTSVIVTVAAGQSLVHNPLLIPPASITGHGHRPAGRPPTAAWRSPVQGVGVPGPGQSDAPPPTPTGRYTFADVDAPAGLCAGGAQQPSLGAIGSATLVLAASQAAVLNITVGSQPAVSAAPTSAPAAAPVEPSTPVEPPAAPDGGTGP